MYPLVQITMGTATLMPSAAFFPFRLHCASLLIALSRQTKVYIPVAALLLEVGRRMRAIRSFHHFNSCSNFSIIEHKLAHPIMINKEGDEITKSI